jgi:hypothetical protein
MKRRKNRPPQPEPPKTSAPARKKFKVFVNPPAQSSLVVEEGLEHFSAAEVEIRVQGALATISQKRTTVT